MRDISAIRFLAILLKKTCKSFAAPQIREPIGHSRNMEHTRGKYLRKSAYTMLPVSSMLMNRVLSTPLWRAH